MSDEFWTQRVDVDAEIPHYKEHLINKIIYCNCDDYRRSNFYRYLRDNFHSLQLKQLITSCWYEKSLFNVNRDVCSITTTDGTKEYPMTNGDFRSPESIELLKQADVVITNPPFSIFNEYICQLFRYNKKFLIMGPLPSVSNKIIRDNLISGDLWLGHKRKSSTEFQVPNNAEKYHRESDGKKYASVANICWFTNLHCNPTPLPLPLKLERKYDENKYHKYDNYDSINIDKSKDIPIDYDGLMGVPISYLLRHDPSRFKIIDIKTAPVINGKTKFIRVIIKKTDPQ